MNKFSDLPLLPEIQQSLDALGFTEPTEIQAKAIPLLLKEPCDVHAQAQTGTGKTLAFGIPLLQTIDPKLKAVQGLVVAPTRELVLQIYESLRDVSRKTGIAIEPIYGGMAMSTQIAGIKRGAQIIVGTPGRLNDHLRRKTLSLKNLKVLVLDEADIMLDMGFRQEIEEILQEAPQDRFIWLFSATVMPGIKKLIQSHMKNVLTIKAEKKGLISTQVEQYYCIAPKRKREEVVARFIEAAPEFYGIIFCRTKMLTAEVMEQLTSRGLQVNCLHGDMSQTLRNKVIRGFKNKDFNILVATDVAARGIDVSDLTHVINFSIPDDHESYIHRIGRTGRAGKTGVAILLIAPSEMYRIKRLEKETGTTLQQIQIPTLETIVSSKMGAVSDFIEQSKKPKEKLSVVHKAIKELIDSFSEEEIRNALALALEDKFFKEMVHEDIQQVEVSSASAQQEICIELGRDDLFTEEDMRHYLHNTCNLSPQDIRKVRVLNKKTFVSIPENRLHECLDLMKTKPIAKKKYRAYLVEDVFPPRRGEGERSRQRSSGGGRGQSRGGGQRRRSEGGNFGGDRGGKRSTKRRGRR